VIVHLIRGSSASDRARQDPIRTVGLIGTVCLGLVLSCNAYAQPVANPATLAVPLNTATTLNLAPFITGAGITGIAVATPPTHGTAAVSGTSVTYTPASNVFGSDSFTYIAFGAGGPSAPAAVTVTISGRPDPGASAAVTGLLSAQYDGARRYSIAQISNYQRRLESLHRRKQSQDTYADGPGANDRRNARGASAADEIMEAAADPDPYTRGANLPPWRVAGTPAGWPSAPEPGLRPSPVPNGPWSGIAAESMNLAAVAGSDGAPGYGRSRGELNFWADGMLNFGTREPGAGRSGTQFSTSGVSIGMDRRMNEDLVLGVGMGFVRDKTDIGFDGTRNRAQGYSIAAYGSYQPWDSYYVDGLIGVGKLDIDTQRFVAPVNAYAAGSRDGYQVFGSLMAGYEHRDGGVLIAPFGRLDFFSNRFEAATETGAGPYALTYTGQTASTVQAAVGLRAEMVRVTDFGWIVPHLRAELRHAFERDRLATASYADQPGGPSFGITVRTYDRDALVLGIGNELVLRDGLSLAVDFQTTNPFSKGTNNVLWVKVAKDLDARGPLGLAGTQSAPLTRLDLQVDAGYLYDDNVTRSRTPGEILSDHAYSLNVTKAQIVPVNENTRALLTYFAGGETFQNYDGLNRLQAGARGELQYRGSGEWDAPTLSLFARIAGERYESTLRNGYRYSVGASVRQPVTDRIDVFGALSHNERYANSGVFTGRDNSARINVDYSLSRTETLYLTGEYRRGDIVSTGSASLDNLSIAKVLVPDDAYPGRQFFSYRFDANTALLTVGYNVGFGPRDSLDLSWRRAEAKPFERWAYSTAPSTYVVNQYSLVYLTRF